MKPAGCLFKYTCAGGAKVCSSFPPAKAASMRLDRKGEVNVALFYKNSKFLIKKSFFYHFFAFIRVAPRASMSLMDV
jgi:hypothetical protein